MKKKELQQIIAGLRFEIQRLQEINTGWRIRCESMQRSGEIAKAQLECNKTFIEEQNRIILGRKSQAKKPLKKSKK